MKSAVLVFPGINRERDMARALKLVSGQEAAMVWHAESALPKGTDLVVVPGGFSYGDYLRCGAIAARAPVMDAVRKFAADGGLVLGVCNGFQILCEAGLLPGVLMRNARLKFICKDVHLRVERSDTPFTRGYNAGQVIRVPVAHGEGNYEADEETVKRLEGEGRVLYRYCSPDGVVDEESNINGAAEFDRRHRQRARQCARHDATPGKPRRRHHGLHRRPRAVRGPRRASGKSGVKSFVMCLTMRLAVAAAALSLAAVAHAQDYPKRPISMIVPFAAGGTSDVIARVVAEEMTKSLGQPIVIENVAGAGGSTALTRAARAEADGYTIAIGNAGTSAATYTIYPKLPFTPESFVPIAVVAKTFGIVALRKDFPAKNLQDFIAYAKKNPGKVNLGHAGVGSSNYLICKSFVQAAGIDVTLVGYRGAAPALTDAIGGQIDGVCDSAASVSQAIDDKLVRGLVVGSTVRLATLPELPTSSEAGLPDFEAQGWNGLFAPKSTPPAIVAKLNAAAKMAVESEAVKKRFHDLSTVAPDANEHASEVLGQLVTRDVEKYRKLLEEKK